MASQLQLVAFSKESQSSLPVEEQREDNQGTFNIGRKVSSFGSWQSGRFQPNYIFMPC